MIENNWKTESHCAFYFSFQMQWMKDIGLAGVMFWSLEMDDFSGQVCCHSNASDKGIREEI